MHFEVLVEDQSGKHALDILLPRVVGPDDTFRVHGYKGIGRIPNNMKDPEDAAKRILLANLPKLLRGYGRAFSGSPEYNSAVILVCDLDDRNLAQFLNELNSILQSCYPRPTAKFCIAIEEGEAWFLGDLPAVNGAFPGAKQEVLASYVNDSICGTWEKLADAVYPGGAKSLSKKGWQAVGAEKFRWAAEISPRMNVENNASPSFCFFRESLRSLSS